MTALLSQRCGCPAFPEIADAIEGPLPHFFTNNPQLHILRRLPLEVPAFRRYRGGCSIPLQTLPVTVRLVHIFAVAPPN
jgi:hypothetical protein